jgi:hypothetical protein
VGEARCAKSYSAILQKTSKFGIRSALAKGVGLGATIGTLLFSYAALLYAGGIVVWKGYTNGAVALAVIFNIIVGSM